jgi:hypothetical protein
LMNAHNKAAPIHTCGSSKHSAHRAGTGKPRRRTTFRGGRESMFKSWGVGNWSYISPIYAKHMDLLSYKAQEMLEGIGKLSRKRQLHLCHSRGA